MGEVAVWDLIANFLVTAAWVGASLFILAYGLRSPWRLTLPGRSLMYILVALWALLSYVMWARWTDPPDLLRNLIAVGVLSSIVVVIWRFLLVVWLVQTGRLNLDRMNWTPLRDWWRNWRAHHTRGV